MPCREVVLRSERKPRPAGARRSRPPKEKAPALELRCHGRLVPLDPNVAELVDDTYRQLVGRVDSAAQILSFALELGLAAYRAWIPVKAAEHEDETERAAREESLRDEIRELAPAVLTGSAVEREDGSDDRFRAVIYCTAQKRSFRTAERFRAPGDFPRRFVRCPFCWIEHSVIRLEEAVRRDDVFGVDDVAMMPAASLAEYGRPLSGLVIGAGKVPVPVTAQHIF